MGESQLISHDVIIGGGFGMPSWNLSGGTQVLQGNLTVMSGGTVTLNNETLMFDDFAAQNSYASYEAAPLFHIIVEDGGKLVMYHSIITTNLQLINDIPVLGIFLEHNASMSMYQGSKLIFPGQFLVYDSTFTMMDSYIQGFSNSSFNPAYINETVFPPGYFANPPVLSAYGSSVLAVNSTISIFRNSTGSDVNPSTVFVEHYPFASDTGHKDTVTYTVEALPSSVNHAAPLADTTKYQSLGNLTAFNQDYYEVQAGQRLAVTNFTTGGVTSSITSVALTVAYESLSGGQGTLFWAFGNTSVPAGSHPLPASSGWTNISMSVPLTSVNDLARSLVWINDSSGTLLVNKLSYSYSFTAEAYNNLTAGGSTSFTAINTYLGANFVQDAAEHSSFVVTDMAHAYLYGVTVNMSSGSGTMLSPPFIGTQSSMATKPLSLGPLNSVSTANDLPLLDSNVQTYFRIPAGGILQTYGMNVTFGATLNTALSGATLYLTSNSSSGDVIYVGEVGQPLSSYIDTGVSLNGPPSLVYQVNLFKLGFTSLEQIANLVVYISNSGDTQAVYLHNMYATITLLPQTYLYRFANITLLSKQGLPIPGMSLAFSFAGSTPNNITAGSTAIYYVAPFNNYQSTPPQAALEFMGKTSSDYAVTDSLGNALVPLLSDVIYASVYPDSMFVGNYTLTTQYNGTQYGSSLDFLPFPSISYDDEFVNFTLAVNAVIPLPKISVERPVVAPSTIYANQSGTITFNVADTGQSGVVNMPVNISVGASGISGGYRTLQVSVAPESQITVTISWKFTLPYNNTINIVANPNQTIPESSYSGDYNSTVFYIWPDLPELVVYSSGIGFNPSPAFSGSSVIITASIENNLGRANATNVTVGFYTGNPLEGGVLIGSTVVTVSAGGSNTANISWTPT
ncbi:MAG: hypothetical protein QXP70_06445, partial [Methanomassiliicoccales archaeon]